MTKTNTAFEPGSVSQTIMISRRNGRLFLILLLLLFQLLSYTPLILGDLNAACSGNNCTLSGETCSSATNKCICGSGYTAETFVCKADLGTVCTANDTCLDPHASCSSSGRCSCSAEYTADQNKCKANLGTVCTANDTCLDPHASCSSSGRCSCSAEYTADQNKCKANNGGSCINNEDCYEVYAMCINKICHCRSGYTDSNGISIGGRCTADLGSLCESNNSSQCTDSNAVCLGSCRCGALYYNSSNVCIALSSLQVQNLTIPIIMETSILVQWRQPVKFVDVSKYEISWKRLNNTGEEYQINVNKDATSANLSSSLIPGASYLITVTSYQIAEINISASIQQAMKPNIPGPLNITNSNFDITAGGLKLAWDYIGASNGANVVYNIELIDSNTPGSSIQSFPLVSTRNVTATKVGLKNGYHYTVTIIAKSESFGSGLRVDSEVYTTLIRTVPQMPGPPSGLTCAETFDISIKLKWTISTMPNGEIKQYIVETYHVTGLLKSENTSSNSTEYNVTDLDPGRRYDFKVFTQNDVGRESTGVPVYGCSTKARMSLSPGSLNTSGITSRSFTITWTIPVEVYGELLGYVLRITTNEDNSCVVEEITNCTSGCYNRFPAVDFNCSNGLSSTKPVSNNTIIGAQSYNGSFNPDTRYKVSVTAVNQGGMGYSAVIYQSTYQEAPQKPNNVAIVNKTSIEANVTWNINGPRPGNTTYTIRLVADSPADNFTSTVTGFLKRSFVLTGLQEFWNYKLTVIASTINGSNESSPVDFTTEEGSPGKVSNLKGNPGFGDKMYITSQVSWQLPLILDRNGIIKTFYIQQEEINGTNAIRLNSTNVTALLDDTAHVYVQTFLVEPEKTYQFTVIAYNGFKGNEHILDYNAPAGPPFIPDEQKLEVIPPSKVSGVGQKSFVIEINTDFFMNDTNGKIADKGLICCEDPICSNDNSTRADSLNLPTYALARKQGRMKYKLPVPVANLTSIPSGSGGRRKRESRNVYQYSVGTEVCDNKPETDYCNGPLEPGHSYRIIAFVCTKGGCTLSRSYGPFKTLAVPDVVSIGAAVGGGVGGGLAVILIAIIVILIVRKRNKKRTRKALDDSNDSSHMENLTSIRKQRPIRLTNFAEYVADYHKDSNLKFSEEYEDLKNLSPQHSHEAADMEDNRLKNRFVNILPFDHSRVRLLPIDDVPGSDYINANYLPGFTKTREYIACQGPIPATIDDHWRLIWEQNVRVIVMLTQYKEENRVKCEPYMPLDLKDPKQYGDLVVECMTYSSMNSFEYRTLKIRLGEKERTIKHFHFLSWRDYSANVQFDTMIDFIKKVRSFIQPPDVEGPMIIHCSAGVGRTGTYITIDYVMQHIDKFGPDSTVDIFNFVLKMRENRTTMVQTEQQYIFIHDCIKEYLDRCKTYENQAFINSEEENLYQNTETIELYQNVGFNSTQKTEL